MPEPSLFRRCPGPGPGSGRGPGVLCSGGVLVPCPAGYLPYIRAHAHTYTRARGFLDDKFLDAHEIFRLQKHKFSIKK